MDKQGILTVCARTQVGKAQINFQVGLTPAKYPIMLILGSMSIDPPATVIITALFIKAFEASIWKEKSGIPLEEIKFPSIIAPSWTCALLFYDKDGKLFNHKLNTDEQEMAGGEFVMQERLVREGYLPHWYVCSPQMPRSEIVVWKNINWLLTEK